MEKLLQFKKQFPVPLLVVMGILLLGIFFRTYHFHDWLRVNADQARDAITVSGVVDGVDAWPLLGPKAGGTNFRLGPVFYYFEIASAKVFGNYPDTMAYADLLFSLLAIPLLFLLLRKYFSQPLSLLLAALFTCSFYAVRYSRFAWNPNSTPFWTMLLLYALLHIFSSRTKRKLLWSMVAGVAVGVGVQLHTFLLASLPILVMLSFGYLAIRKKNLVRYFLVILFVSLCLNIPQFVHEAKTGGENIQAFFSGVKTKQETSKTYLDKVVHTGECFTAANIQIISAAYYDGDTCDIYDKSNQPTLLIGLAGLLFSFGGVTLAVRSLKQETDPERRLFLALVLVYMGILFLLIIPVAYEISLRYFLILIFMPFFFLGLWLKFLGEHLLSSKRFLLVIILLVLFTTNGLALRKNYNDLTGYKESSAAAGFDIVYLGEMEQIAQYIVSHTGASKIALLGGNKNYLFKARNILVYLGHRNGVQILPLEKNHERGTYPTFYLISTKASPGFITGLGKGNQVVLDSASFGRFTVVSTQPAQ